MTACGEAGVELTLFVSGASDLSAHAIAHAKRLCDEHLGDTCDLRVVDIHEDRGAVARHGVMVAPTLIKSRPLPVRRFVGDLAHTDRVLLALQLPVGASTPNRTGPAT